MAGTMDDRISLSWAQQMVGQTQSHLGDFTAARSMLEQVVVAQHEEDRSSLGALDLRVLSRLRLGQVLVLLGYADQGLKISLEAFAIARNLSRPNDLAVSMALLAMTYLMVRDDSSALAQAEAVIELAERNGLSIMARLATSVRGYTLAMRGQTEGLAQMGHGIAAIRAANSANGMPWALSRHAEALQICGRIAEARSVMGEALELAQTTGEGMYLAELHRLAGELAIAQDSSNASEGERCFRTAIEIARRQSARWWELRATMSLARLLRDSGRRDARAMLAEIYNWFTEGFDTADLKDAKALLEELGG